MDEATKQDTHGHRLLYLGEVKKDLEDDGRPLQLSTSGLDSALVEAVRSLPKAEKPLDYLLSCWKRIMRLEREKTIKEDPAKYEVVQSARKMCFSYSMFVVTIPEMFDLENTGENPLASHLLVDGDRDNGICHDFLREAVSKIPEDDTILEAFVGAVEQLSRDLTKLSMNKNYQPYILVSTHRSSHFSILLMVCRLYGRSQDTLHWLTASPNRPTSCQRTSIQNE